MNMWGGNGIRLTQNTQGYMKGKTKTNEEIIAKSLTGIYSLAGNVALGFNLQELGSNNRSLQ